VKAARAQRSAARSTAPWWHQLLLWVLMLASAALVSPAAPPGADRAASLWQFAPDGLSTPSLWAFALGFAICGFVALWMSYRLALRFASSSPALLATIAAWLASSLPVYLYVVPFDMQVVATFSAALFLTLWLSVRDGRDTRARWAFWGLAFGLAIVSSIFNAALLIAALVEWVSRLLRRRALADSLTSAALFLAGAAAILAPVLVTRRQADGGWLIDGNFPIMHWSAPRIAATAFSAEHGAFLWTPILLAAAIGLLFVIKRQPAVGFVLAATSALLFYLVAAHEARTGASFGAPLLLPLTPIFVCGLAALADAVVGSRGKAAWAAAAAAAALFVLWNCGLMLQWGTGVIPKAGPLDLRQAAANQISIVPRAARDSVIRYINERKALVKSIGPGARE
jgi:hypothetical protein